MLLINIYWGTDSGRVFVPAMAKTDAGYLLETNPVEEAAADNVASIALALQSSVSRGQNLILTPTRSAFPEWVVLKAAKKKLRDDFEDEFELLSVERTRDEEFLIRKHTRSENGGGYEPEHEARIVLSGESNFFEIASELKSVAESAS